LGFPETGKYWNIDKELLNKMFLNVDEELTYKNIDKKYLFMFFERLFKTYLQFSNLLYVFVGECV
jgi:hypothetical protein